MDINTGEDLEPPYTVFVDDETGDVHYLESDDEGIIVENGDVVIGKLCFGPGRIKLVRREQ